MKRAATLRIKRSIEALSLRKSHRIIALSRFMGHDLTERFRVPPDKLKIVPGGVNTQVFSPAGRVEARALFGYEPDEFVVFTARRLAKRMGFEMLLEAVAGVAPLIPGLRVLIAGKGPLKARLEERVRMLGITRQVQLLGFVPDELLPSRYRAADLFILPTVALEGFGLVILEALACGTPVLGTPVAAIPEVLANFGSDLVLPGATAEDVARGLLDFYHRRNDPRPDYSAIARSRFKWDRVAHDLMQEIREASWSGGLVAPIREDVRGIHAAG